MSSNLNASITITRGGPLQTQLITMILTAVIICLVFFIYYIKSKKQSVVNLERKGLVLLIDSFFAYIDGLIADIMGPEYKWFTPYTAYLLLYIGIGNFFSLFGWEPPITSYTITLSLGLITFIGIYVAGFVSQKWKYILKFIKNPIDLITQFAPLISITFRIFGNLTAGATIIFLFFLLTSNITSSVPFIGYIDLLGGLIAPILNIYFDIFDGLVQTYIFGILTLAYIGIELQYVHSNDSPRKKRGKFFKKNKKVFSFFNKKDIIKSIN